MIYTNKKCNKLERIENMKFYTSIMVIIVLLFQTPVYSENHTMWYEEWIEIIKELELIDEEISAYEPMKRLDFLDMVLKYMTYDVKKDHVMEEAVHAGLIPSNFVNSPDVLVTRQEVARIVYNVFLLEHSKMASDISESVIKTIKDFDDIHSMYREGVLGCYYEGIMSGYDDGYFKPDHVMNQAEIAVMLSRLALQEKREKLNLNLPIFHYKGLSPSETFEIHYTTLFSDIYHVLNVVKEMENHYILPLSAQNTHDAYFGDDLQWFIKVYRNTTMPYSIEIRYERSKLLSDNDGKALFNYLFVEDSDRLYDQLKTYTLEVLNDDQTIEYKTESMDRRVVFFVDRDYVTLKVTNLLNPTSDET